MSEITLWQWSVSIPMESQSEGLLNNWLWFTLKEKKKVNQSINNGYNHTELSDHFIGKETSYQLY